MYNVNKQGIQIVMSNETHGLWACDALTQTTLFTFRKSVTYKILYYSTSKSRKLSAPDIAFPETLHEKPTESTSKKVQSRINTKSTEKRGKIRWQMKKLFETEIVTHWMAAILKTDLYSKLEHWKMSLRYADANSISRRRRKQKKPQKKTEN